MRKIICFCLLVAIAFSSCHNILDKKVELTTLKDDIAQIRKDNPKDYTDADFDAAGNIVATEAMGSMFAQAMGGKDIDTSKLPKININLTYRQLLDSAQHKRIAYETAKKEYDAEVQELRQAIDVELVDKEAYSDEFGINEYLSLMLKYTTGSRGLKGFTGRFIGYDLFGKELSHFEVKSTEDLKANQIYVSKPQYTMTFDNGMKELAKTDTSKLKFVWEPTNVVFDDGSQLQTPEMPKKP